VGIPVSQRINLNAATEAELQALPGVGPVITRRIIAGRPDRSVDEPSWINAGTGLVVAVGAVPRRRFVVGAAEPER
jgi:hypothetical protein